jgi:hypothetical protein
MQELTKWAPPRPLIPNQVGAFRQWRSPLKLLIEAQLQPLILQVHCYQLLRFQLFFHLAVLILRECFDIYSLILT